MQNTYAHSFTPNIEKYKQKLHNLMQTKDMPIALLQYWKSYFKNMHSMMQKKAMFIALLQWCKRSLQRHALQKMKEVHSLVDKQLW